jgi:hypothetical protein
MNPAEARVFAEGLVAPLGRRWLHVQRVAATAEVLAEGLPEVREQLVVAAWLHDVGYGREALVTGFHPLDGARYLAGLGVEPLIVSLVAHHTGARVEAEERGLGDELAKFAEPPAQLLDVLTAADILSGPDGSPVQPRERIGEILRRYPAGDPVHRAVTRSGPELIATAERVLARLADVRRGTGGVEAVGDPESH